MATSADKGAVRDVSRIEALQDAAIAHGRAGVARSALSGARGSRDRTTVVRVRAGARAACGIAVRAAGAGRAWAPAAVVGARVDLGAAVAVGAGFGLVVLVDRPPHDVQQRGDRDLEHQHQPDEAPGHGGSTLPRPAGARATNSAPEVSGGECVARSAAPLGARRASWPRPRASWRPRDGRRRASCAAAFLARARFCAAVAFFFAAFFLDACSRPSWPASWSPSRTTATAPAPSTSRRPPGSRRAARRRCPARPSPRAGRPCACPASSASRRPAASRSGRAGGEQDERAGDLGRGHRRAGPPLVAAAQRGREDLLAGRGEVGARAVVARRSTGRRRDVVAATPRTLSSA